MATEIKKFLNAPVTKEKFAEVLGNHAQGYINSVLNVVSNSSLLEKAEPNSILSAAMKAATLNLSIDPNLGYAYILPFNEKHYNQQTRETTWTNKAQLQIGYQGLIQLAQRSGQIKVLNAAPIYAEQFKGMDPITGQIGINKKAIPDTTKDPVGYVAYLETVTGFRHTEFMSYQDVVSFAQRFSKSYTSKTSPWKTDFNAMAKKTLIKQVLKYAPMSIELQSAVSEDDKDFEVKDVTEPEAEKATDVFNDVVESEPEPKQIEQPKEAEKQTEQPSEIDKYVAEGKRLSETNNQKLDEIDNAG
ncbi:MAG: recombinase RecT [Oenococcus sp.]|uniref:recombinase RecT n=1 Tax=Oenococcus sp. TaxID=1979414 RepID=UPI0039E98BBC